jgi:hypothetical protein
MIASRLNTCAATVSANTFFDPGDSTALPGAKQIPPQEVDLFDDPNAGTQTAPYNSAQKTTFASLTANRNQTCIRWHVATGKRIYL